jgi:hypothetical protein
MGPRRFAAIAAGAIAIAIAAAPPPAHAGTNCDGGIGAIRILCPDPPAPFYFPTDGGHVPRTPSDMGPPPPAEELTRKRRHSRHHHGRHHQRR